MDSSPLPLMRQSDGQLWDICYKEERKRQLFAQWLGNSGFLYNQGDSLVEESEFFIGKTLREKGTSSR